MMSCILEGMKYHDEVSAMRPLPARRVGEAVARMPKASESHEGGQKKKKPKIEQRAHQTEGTFFADIPF